jgi:hypothetical protein
MRFIWLRGISLRMARMILWFSSTLAIQTNFGYRTWILNCTAEGNCSSKETLSFWCLWWQGYEECVEERNQSRTTATTAVSATIACLPHLCPVHGPLPSTSLGYSWVCSRLDQPMYQQYASSSAWANVGSGEWAMTASTAYEDATSSLFGLRSSSRRAAFT